MLAHPHRKPDGKGADDPPTQTTKVPTDLFRALASRLVGVPVFEMREAERIYAEKKAAEQPDS